MFMRFIIIVFVLGNKVTGQNETEFDFINSLPQNQRTDLLEKIGRRISNEVKVSGKSHAPVMEISKAQMEQFNDFVKNILNQEKTNLRKSANLTDEMKIKSLNKDGIHKSITNAPKKHASENSKIIKIPIKYDEILSKQSENLGPLVEETTFFENSDLIHKSDYLDTIETSKPTQSATAYDFNNTEHTGKIGNHTGLSDVGETNQGMPLGKNELSYNTSERFSTTKERGQVNELHSEVDTTTLTSTTKRTTTSKTKDFPNMNEIDSTQNVVQAVLTTTTSKWIEANEIPTTNIPEINADLTTISINTNFTNLIDKVVAENRLAKETNIKESSKQTIDDTSSKTDISLADQGQDRASLSYLSNVLPMAYILNGPVAPVAPEQAVENNLLNLQIPFALIPPRNKDTDQNSIKSNEEHENGNDINLSQVPGWNTKGKEIFPHKNPGRCRYGQIGASSESSDCRSTEDEYDDYRPVLSDTKEKQTLNIEKEEKPKKISAIVVFLTSKNDTSKVEDIVESYSHKIENNTLKDDSKDLLDPSIDIYQTENDVFERDALSDIIDQQIKSHVSKKHKVKKDCPKQYNTNMYVDALKLIIVNNDEALQNYDWLGTTVDIEAALHKLLNLSSKVLNDEKIHSADYQLLQFVMYLKKIAEKTNEERDSCKSDNNKLSIEEVDLDKLKTDWAIKMPKSEKSGQGDNESLYGYDNNVDSQANDEVADFVSFLNILQTGMYDLHTVITSIAEITKYDKQNWFDDIKNLYLNYANKQDILGVLLHLTLTRIIDFVEDSAKNGLTYNHIQYIVDHQQEILKIADELDFCLVLINEMEKNIYVD